MKLAIKAGSTSKMVGVFIQDSSVSTGAGKTGLTSASAGLSWYYWRSDDGDVNATAVAIVAGTRGTYSSGGFVAKDGASMPGVYEIGVPNAALAAGASWVIMMLKGAADMAPCVLEIQLDLDAVIA